MTGKEGLQKIRTGHQELEVILQQTYGYLTSLPAGQVPGNNNLTQLSEGYNKLLENYKQTIIEVNHDDKNGFFIDKNSRREFAGKVKEFLDNSFNFWDMMQEIGNKYTVIVPSPGKDSYDTLQCFLNTFKRTGKKKLKKEFKNRNISTEGFNQKFDPPMSIKNENRKQAISIIVGIACIAVVVTIYLFKDNVPEELKLILRVLTALGIGGLAAALIGLVTLKMGKGNAISATGGFAMALIFYFFPPFGFGQTDFSSSIFLKDPNNSSIGSEDINLHIRLSENQKPGEYLPSSNTYLFKPIPSRFLETNTELSISENSRWVFENGKKVTSIKLVKGEIDIRVQRDSLSLQVRGRIVNSTSEPIAGAVISGIEENSLRVITDSTGNFKLTLPISYKAENLRLGISHPLYQTKEDIFKLGEFHSITLFNRQPR